jgi:hypothetical protein
VYIHYRYEWGDPFYVGEGKDGRTQDLERAVQGGKSNGYNPHTLRVARKVFKERGCLFVKKVARESVDVVRRFIAQVNDSTLFPGVSPRGHRRRKRARMMARIRKLHL